MLDFDFRFFRDPAASPEEDTRREKRGKENLHEGALPQDEERPKPFPNREGKGEDQIQQKEAEETGEYEIQEVHGADGLQIAMGGSVQRT